MLWIFSILAGLFLGCWVWARAADVTLTFVAGYGGALAIYLAIAIGIVSRLPTPAERKRKG
ncbi:MAG: hypothetical protein Q4G49_05735 [Paracoccus sp. (in: a-proteobacteria)]|nr:hypothetical protein [Paracoccus sp. (in: a-proteobacteria)]